MKKLFSLSLVLLLSLLTPNSEVIAQESDSQSVYIVVRKQHFKTDAKSENWLANEQEYFNKVTSKNEYIQHTEVLQHYYTNDNTDILFISVYKNWEDIEKSSEKITELENEAWPDENKRNDFFTTLDNYYTDEHSDEIYKSYSEIKNFKVTSIDPMIVYLKNSKMNLSGKEGKGFLEYNENVTMKDPYIKGYYTFSHSWGSDSRDFIQVFFYNSLNDLDKSTKETEELVKIAWPNENDRTSFFADYNKYFTGRYQDYIYKNVPSLSKR